MTNLDKTIEYLHYHDGASRRELMESLNLGIGDTQVKVANSGDFRPGQLVLIGGNKVTIASIQPAPRFRGFGGQQGQQEPPADTITLTAPVKFSAIPGCEFTGTGVGIATPLKYAHKAGEAVSVNLPTPGRPNKY